MYRFVLRGRWLVGTLLVLVAVAATVRLGIWQLDRRDQRLDFNARVAERGALPPASLDSLISSADGAAAAEAIEHRRVVVRGHFDPGHEVLVRARSLAGTPGQHVLTPLVTAEGAAILVNRGFVPITDPRAPVPPDAKPPKGSVRVEGTLRAGERGRFDRAAPEVAEVGTVGWVTAVAVERLAEVVPYELYPAYVRVESERPERGVLPVALGPVEPGEGPHLSYAVQWFSMAGVLLVGWPVLVHRTARQRAGRQEVPL